MTHQTILTLLGLSEQEARIYTTLLSIGEATVSDIFKETGMHRPRVYAMLSLLKKRDLVTTITRGKRLLYCAETPRRLHALLDEKTHELYAFVSELEHAYHTRTTEPRVKVLRGKRNIRFVFEDLLETLNQGDVFYRISSARESHNEYLPSDYRKKRDAKHIERFVITNTERERQKSKRLERQTRFIPKAFAPFTHDIIQLIYKDKIAIIDFKIETVILIENPMIAAFYKDTFRALYTYLPTTQ